MSTESSSSEHFALTLDLARMPIGQRRRPRSERFSPLLKPGRPRAQAPSTAPVLPLCGLGPAWAGGTSGSQSASGGWAVRASTAHGGHVRESRGLWEPDGSGVGGAEKDFTNLSQVRKRGRASETKRTCGPRHGGVTDNTVLRGQTLYAVFLAECGEGRAEQLGGKAKLSKESEPRP